MRFRSKIVIFAVVSILFGFNSIIASAEPEVTLPARVVGEENKPEAYISGNWLVGIHLRANLSKNRPSLIASLPGGWKGHIVCARATTISGKYFAFMEYTVPRGWKGGVVRFEYPTRFSEVVKLTNIENSGVAIHKGACQADSNEFVPARWNANEIPTQDALGRQTLVLNMNVGRADEVLARALIGDKVLVLKCSAVPGKGRTSFNHRCWLTVPMGWSGKMPLEVIRIRSGNFSKPRHAFIHMFPD